MITDIGKNIIAKYFLGHTSSYASHIAVGCGATPLSQADDPIDYVDEYAIKDTLDFEMFRVPIVSRGYIKEDDTVYVVLTGELPTNERYGVTEVGLYSAGSNSVAGVADSKMLFTFAELENWEEHTATSAEEIPTITGVVDDENNEITEDSLFFRINSENSVFLNENRISANEVPRFLNSSILVAGSTSTINVTNTGTLSPDDTESSHIHLTGLSLNLDQNAPSDQLKLAFSLIPKNADPDAQMPEEVRIILQFASGETQPLESASMEIRLINNVDGVSFENNRYYVATQELQDLTKTIGFSWSAVNIAKVYTSVIFDGVESDDFYIAYDGLRLENKTDINPLYGLTGYSVIKNNEGVPVLKSSNSSTFIEFRFGFDLSQAPAIVEE